MSRIVSCFRNSPSPNFTLNFVVSNHFQMETTGILLEELLGFHVLPFYSEFHMHFSNGFHCFYDFSPSPLQLFLCTLIKHHTQNKVFGIKVHLDVSIFFPSAVLPNMQHGYSLSECPDQVEVAQPLPVVSLAISLWCALALQFGFTSLIWTETSFGFFKNLDAK